MDRKCRPQMWRHCPGIVVCPQDGQAYYRDCERCVRCERCELRVRPRKKEPHAN